MAECKLVQSGGQYYKCCSAPHVCQPPNCCPGFPIGKSVCFGDGSCVNKTWFTTDMPPQNVPPGFDPYQVLSKEHHGSGVKKPYGFGYGARYRYNQEAPTKVLTAQKTRYVGECIGSWECPKGQMCKAGRCVGIIKSKNRKPKSSGFVGLSMPSGIAYNPTQANIYRSGRQLLAPNPCNSSFYPRPWYPYGLCP